MTAAARVVVDIGNSRIKWGLLDATGRIAAHSSWDTRSDPEDWDATRIDWMGSTCASWAIASVNPPVAQVVDRWLKITGTEETRWYKSAADVPLTMSVREPSRAGADRALAVLAARALVGTGRAGLVISCGTALTIERVDEFGVWEGGAIAPGLDAASDAMRRSTAQLPRVELTEDVPAWGDGTESAMKAGAFWGTVGALRELIARQGDRQWFIWTGGHASLLARHVADNHSTPTIVPDLVLQGLAIAAFGTAPANRMAY